MQLMPFPSSAFSTTLCHSIPMFHNGTSTLAWSLSGAELSHLKLNFVALVRKRTIPTEQQPLVGEVSANFCVCHVVSTTDPLGR
jgi:hypothetical protein